MAYNTSNPLGSTDPRDLSDNSENFDKLANGTDPAYADRLGNKRKSFAGMESEFAAFIAASGYEFVGNYAAGITITGYQQVVKDVSGEFWRLDGATALPYTTTGAGLPEGGAFLVVGDAAIRQELNASTTGQGSDLVAHTGTTDTVTQALDKRTIYVGSVASLRSSANLSGAIYLQGYYSKDSRGSGHFYVDSTDTVSADNGGTIIVNASGQRLKREDSSILSSDDFGAHSTVAVDSSNALVNMFSAATNNTTMVIEPGEYNYVLADTKLQLTDLENIYITGYGARIWSNWNLSNGSLRLFDVLNCSNVVISGLEVDFEVDAAPVYGQGLNLSVITLYATVGNNITVKDCSFRSKNISTTYPTELGVPRPEGDSPDYKIIGCYVRGDHTTPDRYRGVSFINNKFKDMTARNLWLWYCDDVVVDSNSFETFTARRPSLRIISSNRRLRISNNLFTCLSKTTDHQFVFLNRQVGSATEANSAAVTGNIFKYTAAVNTGAQSSYCVAIKGYNDIVITSNIMSRNEDVTLDYTLGELHPFKISADETNTGSYVFSENIVTGTDGLITNVFFERTVFGESLESVKVSGNTFKKCGLADIGYVCLNLIVEGNSFVEGYSINFKPVLSGRFSNNFLENVSFFAYDTQGARNYLISGNSINSSARGLWATSITEEEHYAISITGVTGTFAVNDTVTGGTSGAVATVSNIYDSTQFPGVSEIRLRFTAKPTTNEYFQEGETVTSNNATPGSATVEHFFSNSLKVVANNVFTGITEVVVRNFTNYPVVNNLTVNCGALMRIDHPKVVGNTEL